MLMEPDGAAHVTDMSGLAERLGRSYEAAGNFEQANVMLTEGRPHMAMMGQNLVLLDLDYRPITGAPTQPLDAAARRSAIPIVARGEPVGYLVVEGRPGMGGAMASELIGQVTRGAWTAAALATVGALALALFIVRSLSAPLASMSQAAQMVAAGDLAARAPVAGPDEVKRVGRAFNSMASALERQERDRRALLADIAHELRTPLAVMQAQIEALIDGVFEPTPETLANLHGQTGQLTRLVADLRTLADADAGMLTLEVTHVPVAEAATSAMQAIAVLADAKGIGLEAAVADDLAPLRADPARLQQVLANVLGNAAQHTPVGGKIRLEAKGSGPDAIIAISDTGSGIDPESLHRIFDRFYRGDESRTRSTGGSGLGLAIARQLTEAHGGTIAADSTLGQGTTIRIAWPLAAR